MRKKGQKKKFGRNKRCRSGTGTKCKKSNVSNMSIDTPDLKAIAPELQKKIAELEALQKQREKQQGLGRPIISTFFQGYRIVAVGNVIHWSRNWKTFHDFLLYYIEKVFGSDWGNVELQKDFEDRHPIFQWYELTRKNEKQMTFVPGQVHRALMTGAWAAYLGLAYNLYLLAHNAKIQESLVERLKNRDQFPGAYYETYVAAVFIKAGFELEFENEADGSMSHCEFTATYPKTGSKFSVEAKARAAGKSHADVGSQLYGALAKEANHTRVVFTDVNVPDNAGHQDSVPYLEEVLACLRGKEQSLTIRGEPAPPAYVIVTNHPYQYSIETPYRGLSALAEGFKIPDFKIDAEFANTRGALQSLERHYEIFNLMGSILDHYQIPSTFEGEIPEFAFGENTPKLLIGHKYLIPVNDKEMAGELVDVDIDEQKKLALGVYRLEDGRSIIASCPITDDELSAYQRNPDTFFGVYRRKTRKISNYLELFLFFYDTHRQADRSKLLDFMKDHSDYEVLKERTQEELAIIYCERLVDSMMKMSNTGKPFQPTLRSDG
jgi:hypothetical protein